MIKKYHLFISLLLVSFLYNCKPQTEKNNDNRKDKKGIKKQIRVRGTRFYFYPPDDFVQSQHFNGFENVKQKVGIVFMEFDISIDSLKKDSSKYPNKTLNTEVVEISGFKADYEEAFIWKDDQKLFSQSLIFGTDTNSVLILATGINDSLRNEIKNSFLSIYYDPLLELKTDKWFTIGNKNTEDLKFSKIFQKMYAYTQHSDIKMSGKKEYAFMVRRDLGEVDTSKVKGYTQTIFKDISNFEHFDDVKKSSISINGLHGYEFYSVGFDAKTGEEKLVYLVYLFNSKNVYRLFGVAFKNYERNLILFKEFARSFKVKGI